MNAVKSETIRFKIIKLADYRNSGAVQVCLDKGPLTCGAHSFDARTKIVTKMYFSRQHLLIDHAQSYAETIKDRK